MGKRIDRETARKSQLELNKSTARIAFAERMQRAAFSRPLDLARAARQGKCLTHHSPSPNLAC